MKKYKSIYKEEINFDFYNNIKNYFESKINLKNYKVEIRGQHKQETIYKNNKTEFIIEAKENNSIFIDLYYEKILNSQSLADPTKKYISTTSSIIKKQKNKLRKLYFEDEIDIVKKDINNYFTKLKNESL